MHTTKWKQRKDMMTLYILWLLPTKLTVSDNGKIHLYVSISKCIILLMRAPFMVHKIIYLKNDIVPLVMLSQFLPV